MYSRLRTGSRSRVERSINDVTDLHLQDRSIWCTGQAFARFGPLSLAIARRYLTRYMHIASLSSVFLRSHHHETTTYRDPSSLCSWR